MRKKINWDFYRSFHQSKTVGRARTKLSFITDSYSKLDRLSINRNSSGVEQPLMSFWYKLGSKLMTTCVPEFKASEKILAIIKSFQEP